MPRIARASRALPKYRRHRASGQAVVTIGGKDFYLGPHGTKVSKAEYDRLIAEWLAAGRRSLEVADESLTVDEVLAAYWRYAKGYYRKNGEPTKELDNIRYALRPLQELYGHTPARKLGPKALQTIRQGMIDRDLSRKVINRRIEKIKRCFKWAVSQEILPERVLRRLATVEGLKAHRTEARETPPVRPVDDAVVAATLPHLPPVVADMVRFQGLTGCRPGEVCMLRPGDIDRSGKVWTYRPGSHKTEHHSRTRVICIGPRAQQILMPYLLRDAETYCFSPGDSERQRRAGLRAFRKSPVQPSQQGRRGRSGPPRKYRTRYSKDAYNWAIRRACARMAGLIEPRKPKAPEALPEYKRDRAEYNAQLKELGWSPNQLRHTAATKLRREFGLEAAQLVLGHARADVTQIYAERDLTRAAAIIQEVG